MINLDYRDAIRSHLVLALSVPGAAVLLFYLRTLTGNLAFGVAGAALALAHFAYVSIRNPDDLKRIRWIVAALVLVTIFAGVNAEASNYRSLYYAGLGWCSLAIGLHFRRHLDGFLAFSRLFLFVNVLMFVVLSARYGDGPLQIELFFGNSSRNIVQFVALAAQIAYSAAYYLKFRRLPMASAAITVLISVLCYGRSGIVVAVALLAISFINNVVDRRFRAAAIATSILVIGIALIPVSYALSENRSRDLITEQRREAWGDEFIRPPYTPDEDKPPIDTNLGSKTNTPRWSFISGYIDGMTLRDAVLGRPLSDVAAIQPFHSNPHNSYIRGHSYFGVAYLVFLAMIGLSLLYGLNQRQWVMVGLVTLYLARSFTDTYALFDQFDFAIFVPLLFLSPVSLPRQQPSG